MAGVTMKPSTPPVVPVRRSSGPSGPECFTPVGITGVPVYTTTPGEDSFKLRVEKPGSIVTPVPAGVERKWVRILAPVWE